MVIEGSKLPHPTDDELVAYLGHELEGEALRRLELHLAQCAACRHEVLDAREAMVSVGALPPRRWTWWPVSAPVAAAAAAGLILFLSWPQTTSTPTNQPIHRETPVELRVAPVPVSPVGPSAEAGPLVWTRVPDADRYRLTLFEAEGSVLFRATTADSLISLPDSIILHSGRPYLWKVEARVGWDVWESSDLIEFQLEGVGSPAPDTGGPR